VLGLLNENLLGARRLEWLRLLVIVPALTLAWGWGGTVLPQSAWLVAGLYVVVSGAWLHLVQDKESVKLAIS